jgi:hypothetical protein
MLNGGILALRRRGLWEAADSGLLLWRRNLGYFIPFFAIPFWLSAFGLLFLSMSKTILPFGLFGNFPLGRAWVVLWWLNPLFDRFILHVAAARYFEPHSSFPSLFRGLPGSLFRGLPGDLLWRRFSPWRAVMMPLRVLEGPAVRSRGAWRRVADRKRALSGGGFHFCIFLTAWCHLLQWILIAGEILFVLLISRQFNVTLPDLGNLLEMGGLYFYTLWCVNYLVAESLYVCMGFGLYLNSRVEVEGWDIELLFRQFTARRRKAAALALLVLILPGPVGVFGQSGPDPAPGPLLPPAVGESMPAESLKEILRSSMGGERKVRTIRFKNEDRADLVSGFPSNSAPFPWLVFFRTLLILASSALVLICGIYLYRRMRPGLPPESPENLVSRKAPAPEFLVEEAGRLHRRGLVREAWGLCYRASLGALTRYRLIRFPAGATEYRCLALYQGGYVDGETNSYADGAADGETNSIADGEADGTAGGFADLIRHWVALAYGGITPPDGAFDAALAWASSLCGEPERGRPSGGRRPGDGHD